MPIFVGASESYDTDAWEAYNLKKENEKLREQVMQLKLDWEGERDYADQMEAKEIQAVAENMKLRELLVGAYEDMDAWQKVIASSDQWGYGKGCLERLCELRDAMRELGIEVDG